MEALGDLAGGSLRRSSVWRSAPVDCPPDSPPFINAVVGLAPATGWTPWSLLDRLQAMERAFGRLPKTVLNQPRPLDLDMILWGDLQLESERLVLPHPRAHGRRFVLQPLAEFAPDLLWPGQGRTVAQLLADLDEGGALERLLGAPTEGM